LGKERIRTGFVYVNPSGGDSFAEANFPNSRRKQFHQLWLGNSGDRDSVVDSSLMASFTDNLIDDMNTLTLFVKKCTL
jgi:hypothetical protein